MSHLTAALDAPAAPPRLQGVWLFGSAWLAVIAEAAVLVSLGTPWSVGKVLLTPLVLAAPLALAVAARELAASGYWSETGKPLGIELVRLSPLLAATVGAACAGGLALCMFASPRLSAWDALGFVAAALFEEALFRVALPVCVWQVLGRLGAGPATVPLTAAVSAVAFALMPGHLAQVESVVGLAPFVCLALLLLGVVWLGRDPVLAVLAHCGVNTWMIAAATGATPAWLGRCGVAAIVVPIGIGLARRCRAAARPHSLGTERSVLDGSGEPQVHGSQHVLDVEPAHV